MSLGKFLKSTHNSKWKVMKQTIFEEEWLEEEEEWEEFEEEWEEEL